MYATDFDRIVDAIAADPDLGPVDGVCGSRTIAAIQAFQAHFLRAPDGRVDPCGRTWRELLGL